MVINGIYWKNCFNAKKHPFFMRVPYFIDFFRPFLYYVYWKYCFRGYTHQVNFTLILIQENNSWKIFQDTYW